MFHGAHGVDGAYTMLFHQESHLVHAHAMFPRAGAVHADGARDHVAVDLFGAGDVGGIIGIDQHLHVEVAVAHVADDGVDQTMRLAIGLGGEDAFGQARNGHAAVGGNGAAAGAHLQQGEIRVVARGPQARALFGAAGPFEIAGAVFRRDGLHQLRLLGHAGRRAVEFKQQQRFLWQHHLVIGVDGLDAVFIEKLDPCHRNTHLDGLDHGTDGFARAGE